MRCLRCGNRTAETVGWPGQYWRCGGCGFGCWTNMAGARRYSQEEKGWTDLPDDGLMMVREIGEEVV